MDDTTEGNIYNVMLGERIRQLRRDSGYTLKDFAEIVPGKPHFTTISKLEKGQIPVTPDWIERVARALGIEPLELTHDGYGDYGPKKIGVFSANSINEYGYPVGNPSGWAPAVGGGDTSYAVVLTATEAEGFPFDPWLVVVDPELRHLFNEQTYVLLRDHDKSLHLAIYLDSPARFRLWPDGAILEVGSTSFKVLGTAVFQSRTIHAHRISA